MIIFSNVLLTTFFTSLLVFSPSFANEKVTPIHQDPVDVKNIQVSNAEPLPAETTTSQGWYESQYEIIIDSLPDQASYNIGEPLNLTGLKVSLVLYDQHGNMNNIYISVSPADAPKVFVVDTSKFDSTKAGTYAINISCTDKYQAFLPTDMKSFEVDVKAPIETSTEIKMTTTSSFDKTNTTTVSTTTVTSDIQITTTQTSLPSSTIGEAGTTSKQTTTITQKVNSVSSGNTNASSKSSSTSSPKTGDSFPIVSVLTAIGISALSTVLFMKKRK